MKGIALAYRRSSRFYRLAKTPSIGLTSAVGGGGETPWTGGGGWKNQKLLHLLVDKVKRCPGSPEGISCKPPTFVKDRICHGYRYAIDASKIHQEFGWKAEGSFEDGLIATAKWYLGRR